MTSWLQRQRKQSLIDLSVEVGLAADQDWRKDEIVDALDAYLQRNATRLSRLSAFDPYYNVRRTPFKTRASSAMGPVGSDDGEVKSVVRGRGRQATKVKDDVEDDRLPASSPVGTSSTALATDFHSTSMIAHGPTASQRRTPGRPPKRQSMLPPSPADVANLAEYESSQVYAGLNDLYSLTSIDSVIASVRESCSSIAAVQMAVLLLEILGLQRTVLPWLYAFDVTGSRGLGMPTIAVYYPDLFKLLTSDFWLPTLLWSLTSLVVPSLFAYFFNLTIKEVRGRGGAPLVSVARYTIDPLTFNIVKALVTWMVYAKNVDFGFIDPVTAVKTSQAMFGGYNGVLVGCYVCIVASVYEAAQRK
ncbi:hypothetical protein LTR08_000074 [Meristemomyces frigidus]|nr:hypothetical protein LTR08_000074 [Meristemomyces frigidus]